jgi:hypothetical protein
VALQRHLWKSRKEISNAGISILIFGRMDEAESFLFFAIYVGIVLKKI